MHSIICIRLSSPLQQHHHLCFPHSSSSLPQSRPLLSNPIKRGCRPLQQQQQLEVESGILCEPCNGRGWLLCEFCKGQKTNVKTENSRIYRRCPSCRATGYMLCSNCKVFKCVTFPNYGDGEEITS